MPLSLIKLESEVHVNRISGNDKTRTFLTNLGFVPGTPIRIVSEVNGDIIVKVMDSRIAISKEMASKIIVY